MTQPVNSEESAAERVPAWPIAVPPPLVSPGAYSEWVSGLAPQGAGRGVRVLHLVGEVTEPVAGFLMPVVRALGSVGAGQTIVALAEPGTRAQLDELSSLATLVPVPADGGGLRKWINWLLASRKAMELRAADIVHLHGLIPSLVMGVTKVGRPDAVFMSPHGSRLLRQHPRLQSLIEAALRQTLMATVQRPMVSSPVDALALQSGAARDVLVIDSPVDAEFTGPPPVPKARFPLILGGASERQWHSAAQFARLAVWLDHADIGVTFNWMADADAATEQLLLAAQVASFSEGAPRDRYCRLAAAWIYLEPMPTRGFPFRLAEAMAAGCVCVVIDTPEHRAVVNHGETGFLCRDEHEMLAAVAQIVDSTALRERLAGAAREEALRRFRPAAFERAVLSGYGMRPLSSPPGRSDPLVVGV